MAPMSPTLTIEQFETMLPKICDRKTTSDPDNWTLENPLWGHCAVVTLVANNLFGGKMLRAEMIGQNNSHYWNRLPGGAEKDFTKSQFGNSLPELADIVIRERSYVLYDPKTGLPREIMARYKLLAWRLAKELNRGNSLFYNHFYQKCFFNALDSPCQKMKFGAVIVHQAPATNFYELNGIGERCNKTIEPLKSLCEPNCIRLNIPSRTESMIGACSHAEENALWSIVKMGIPLNECVLYVAGIYPNGLPHIKKANEFTCMRCAVQIYHSRIKSVFVPIIGGWQYLSGEDCVRTAISYAMKIKMP